MAWNRMGNSTRNSMMWSTSCNSNQAILFDMEYFGVYYYYILVLFEMALFFLNTKSSTSWIFYYRHRPARIIKIRRKKKDTEINPIPSNPIKFGIIIFYFYLFYPALLYCTLPSPVYTKLVSTCSRKIPGDCREHRGDSNTTYLKVNVFVFARA